MTTFWHVFQFNLKEIADDIQDMPLCKDGVEDMGKIEKKEVLSSYLRTNKAGFFSKVLQMTEEMYMCISSE